MSQISFQITFEREDIGRYITHDRYILEELRGTTWRRIGYTYKTREAAEAAMRQYLKDASFYNHNGTRV